MVEIKLRSDPLRNAYYVLEEIQHLNSDPGHWRLTSRPHVWRPPTDVYETEDNIVVRVEIAGMRESDFSISLAGRYLAIRGVRSEVSERRAYQQMEIRFGEFNADVDLPYPVVADQIQAVYDHGFLRIVLPKAHPQQIHIDT